MPKIHLLTRKEEINSAKLTEGYKVAVVLDILLATTTITSVLFDGAREVIPVLNPAEARHINKTNPKGDYLLAGEDRAFPLKGFLYPSPILLRPFVKGKSILLSTTNGTVALRNAAVARKVFVASLLNNQAVSDAVKKIKGAETIVVICAGNSGEFCLEDFYGAGDFIHCLMKDNEQIYSLSDAAKTALFFYQGTSKMVDVLSASSVGQFLQKVSSFDEVLFASTKRNLPIVPILEDQKVVNQLSNLQKE
ncbi:2-phosphosulfolactate phosphatase [Bacillus sp. 2205SS5-2]|uniref:2-phosphosulfolactate phosphatase n=1 Tax=Bacillus sp. 2205SS5-2 TaxID=3109031 RepID=UPI0030049427